MVAALIYAIGDVSGAHLNPVVSLAFAFKRLVGDGASIEIKAVEEVADCRTFRPGTLNRAFTLLLHAVDHISENRAAIGLEADNFAIKQR